MSKRDFLTAIKVKEVRNISWIHTAEHTLTENTQVKLWSDSLYCLFSKQTTALEPLLYIMFDAFRRQHRTNFLLPITLAAVCAHLPQHGDGFDVVPETARLPAWIRHRVSTASLETVTTCFHDSQTSIMKSLLEWNSNCDQRDSRRKKNKTVLNNFWQET